MTLLGATLALLPQVAFSQSGRELSPARILSPEFPGLATRFGDDLAADDGVLAIGHPGAYSGPLGATGDVELYSLRGSIRRLDVFQSPVQIQGALFGEFVDIRDGLVMGASPLFQPPGRVTRGFAGIAHIDDLDGDVGIIASTAVDLVQEPVMNIGDNCAVVDRDTVIMFERISRLQSNPLAFGGVFVFTRGPLGDWCLSQTIQSDMISIGGLGAWSGEFLAVEVAGRVFMYSRDSSGTFVEEQIIRGPYPTSPIGFGASIAIEDDLLVIGGPGGSGFAVRTGAYVYRLNSAGRWVFEAELLNPEGFIVPIGVSVTNDRFGTSVDIDNGRVLVGAPNGIGDSTPWSADRMLGDAYVFEKRSGQWQETFRLRGANLEPQADFGHTVALSGDTAAVGAPTSWFGNDRCGMVQLFALPFGEQVCTGVSNSTGEAAHVELTGDRRVDFGSLHLTGTQLPPAQFAVPLMSSQTRASGTVNLGDGALCLGGTISRPLVRPVASDADGTVEFDLSALLEPSSASSTVIHAGDTWFFQVWYRDQASASGSNLSDAVEVSFR